MASDSFELLAGAVALALNALGPSEHVGTHVRREAREERCQGVMERLMPRQRQDLCDGLPGRQGAPGGANRDAGQLTDGQPLRAAPRASLRAAPVVWSCGDPIVRPGLPWSWHGHEP